MVIIFIIMNDFNLFKLKILLSNHFFFKGMKVFNILTVPDSATGPQGYKPLVDWNNVGKGSRLNRSVS